MPVTVAAWQSENFEDEELDRLEKTTADAWKKAQATLGFVALALLAAAYLFMGFTRGTRNALQSIAAGARSLASGQFSERIHVNTRDEPSVVLALLALRVDSR